MNERDVRGDVLVVDDNPANLRLLSQMLAGKGHKVRLVTSGAQALVSARSSPPDLVLLDIMMPGLDGFEVCRQLKGDERTRDVPVLFLSALGAAEDKVQAFRAGGVDYVGKPFQAEEVLARVETHLALRRAQRRLTEQVAERDAFAHTVAHDLKNPLSTLIGYAELLEESELELDGRVLDCVRPMVKTARRMVRIVDELLLLASVGREGVTLERVEMADVVAEALDRLQPLVAEVRARVVLPEPSSWPVALGHAPWVEEVWVNYVSNAVKYGGSPPLVELGAEEPRTDADGVSRVRFWVRDGGRGLEEAAQDGLFSEFSRLSARGEGHGLGLSIVRRIVERLGGAVGVESRPGGGSRFWFSLLAAGE